MKEQLHQLKKVNRTRHWALKLFISNGQNITSVHLVVALKKSYQGKPTKHVRSKPARKIGSKAYVKAKKSLGNKRIFVTYTN